MNLEFYDVMREIVIKYNIPLIDWEQFMQDYENDGLGWQMPNELICSPSKSIQKVLEILGIQETIDSELTIQDILDTYEGKLELNQIIEYENFQIKIIEIKENRVTAVLFMYHE